MKRTYAELVFHVLSHVPSNAPSSCFEPEYIAWCDAALGSSAARELSEDARVLGLVLAGAERHAQVQQLALLFEDAEQAHAVRHQTLADLSRGGAPGIDLAVAAALIPLGDIVEVLRVSCELERRHLFALQPPSPSAELAGRLEQLACCAPLLTEFAIRELRPLWRRGRLFTSRREIWVGAGAALQGPGVEHIAWQAAHEATLAELLRADSAASLSSPERHLEYGSLVLLAARARGVGEAPQHAVWRRHLRGGLPHALDELRAATSEELACLVESLL